jgi:hypothetical protein
VRYQTALHSVTSGASIDRPIPLRKLQNSKAGAFLRTWQIGDIGRRDGAKSHTSGKFC